MEKSYILPSILYRDSIHEQEDYIRSVEILVKEISELHNGKDLVIVAEPGNGKTRLLEYLIETNKDENNVMIYLDLKSVTSLNPIDKEIRSKLSSEICLEDFITKAENASKKSLTICCDALDEVKKDEVLNVIKSILALKVKFGLVRIVLSSRTYVYKNYENILAQLNAQLLEVRPFSHFQISKYLKIHEFNQVEIDQILNRFQRQYQLEVINSPRTLEIFVQLKQLYSVESLILMSKAELLDHFIYSKLEKEAQEWVEYSDLIKRVLEKLALTMQIYQTNEIYLDELLTFLDDINSNLSHSLTSVVPTTKIVERLLLIKTFDGKKIKFQNAEFQEYLAAKELQRFEKVEQALFDFTVNKNTFQVYPKWNNTIKYLVELNPKLLPSLIDFTLKNEKGINIDFAIHILISQFLLASRLEEEEKDQIFKLFFEVHSEQDWILRYDLKDKIELFYTENTEDYLKSFTALGEEGSTRINTLIASTAGVKQGLFHDRQYWRQWFLSCYKNNSKENHLPTLIYALASFGDLDLLRDNVKAEGFNNSSMHAILSSAIDIDPNNQYTIDLIIESIKGNQYDIYPRKTFAEVTSSEGLTYYLTKLIEDPLLLYKFTENSSETFYLNEILNNLDNKFNSEIGELLLKLITLSNTFYEQHNFISNVTKLLYKKNPNFLIDLINVILKNDAYINNPVRFNTLLSVIIEPSNVNTVLQNLGTGKFRHIVANLFWINFKDKGDSTKDKIFELSKSQFQDIYSIYEKQAEDYKKLYGNKANLYENFKKKLGTTCENYTRDLFSFYKSNSADLSKIITTEDKLRMKSILQDCVLNYDFSKAHVTYQDVNARRYSQSNIIWLFEHALPLFSEFGIDLQLHRKILIEFVPFAFNNDRNKFLFSILGDLSKEELDKWFSFYSTPRKDDTTKIFIHNFFDVCKRYKVKQALPKLREILFDANFDYNDRKQALDSINTISPSPTFFKNAFEIISKRKDKDNIALARDLNNFLIQIPSEFQREAVKWRVNLIKKKPPHPNQKFDSINYGEFSYRLTELTTPLGLVSATGFLDLYIDLFRFGIELAETDKFSDYAHAIWGLIIKYVDNLKIHNNIEPLIELEKEINKHGKKKSFKAINRSFLNLKLIYTEIFGKPMSISECIKIYNGVKATIYNNVKSVEDFKLIIEKVVAEDIERWILKEGAYKFLSDSNLNETMLQKILKTQFQYLLGKRGLRECEVDRETQLDDDKRTDFIISYGFCGRILIEIKLCHNTQATAKKYVRTLTQYIEGTKSHYGIYLLFQTIPKPTWKSMEPKLIALYKEQIESKKIKLFGIDCTMNSIPIKKRKSSKKNIKKKS